MYMHACTHQPDHSRAHGRASNEGGPPPHIMPTSSSSSSNLTDAYGLRHLGARKKLNLSEVVVGSGSVAGGVVEGVTMGGASHMRVSGSGSSISSGALVGGVSTPVKDREQSSLVSLNCECMFSMAILIETLKIYMYKQS